MLVCFLCSICSKHLLQVKDEFYNLDSTNTISIHEVEIEKEEQDLKEPETSKLKYPCTKCEESFALKVDLKVLIFMC